MSVSIVISEALSDRLSSAKNVAVLTGAGVSAESGVKTFRDHDGYWSQYRPEDLASPDGFRRHPKRVQAWYAERRAQALSVQPNPGHLALVDMEDLFPQFDLITQNVDNLHRRAGSRNVVELHGNIMRVYCAECGLEATDIAPTAGEVSRCDTCGGHLRPDVVWFGEMLPATALSAAFEATEQADVFLVAGTAAEVFPAAGLPLRALAAGAYVVEINIGRTTLSGRVDESILAPTGIALPEIVKNARHARSGEEHQHAETHRRPPV